MRGRKLTVAEKEIMVEMICDQNASLANVDAELKKHGFDAMNESSYSELKIRYCPVFKKDPEKKRIHIYERSLTYAEL